MKPGGAVGNVNLIGATALKELLALGQARTPGGLSSNTVKAACASKAAGLGVNLLQWALLGGGVAALVAAFTLERLARAREIRDPPFSLAAPASRPWTVYLLLWAIALATGMGQTSLLHLALVAALVACAPALPWPAWTPAVLARRAWLSPALAAILLVPVGIRLQRAAQARPVGADLDYGNPGQEPRPPAPGRLSGLSLDGQVRTWTYEVSPRHRSLVRIAGPSDSPATVGERRQGLGLSLATTPTEIAAEPAAERRVGRLWLGGGASYGGAQYIETGTCGGPSILVDRRASGGWGVVEREEPLTASSVLWFGGRVGSTWDDETRRTPGAAVDVNTETVATQRWMANLWAEWEHTNFAIGLGVMGSWTTRRENDPQRQIGGKTTRFEFLPAAHLRGGFSFLSAELGMNDRLAPLGVPLVRLGLTGAIARNYPMRHPDDALARVFVGAMSLPGSNGRMLTGPSFGLDLHLDTSLTLSLLGGVGGDGQFVGLSLRGFPNL